jgi:enoyl-CoA hydratase
MGQNNRQDQEMDYELLLTRLDEAVFTITINNEEKLNALNDQVIRELDHAFGVAAADDAVRVVVLTGAGERSFIAGADISEFQGLDGAAAMEKSRAGQELTLKIQNLGKPVIAAVNGFALGGGCEFAMACTMRIASENALFGQPEIKLGLLPGFGGVPRLLRLAGTGKALELMLTGDPVDAHEAARIGLVNHVVKTSELRDTVARMATRLARAAPLAVAAILEAGHACGDLSLEAGLAKERSHFGHLFGTEDMQEGVQAFLEKRKPEFRGR